MTVHTEPTPAEAANRLALRELFDADARCADRPEQSRSRDRAIPTRADARLITPLAA
jgi:hypothetical protein